MTLKFLILAILIPMFIVIMVCPKKRPKWWIESIFNGLIIGSILIFFSFYLDSVINPLPQLNVTCFRNNTPSIYLNISNPSKYVAEDYNILIYEKWGGNSGSSFPASELCKVEYHNHVPEKLTSIKCDYVPPRSNIIVKITFEDNTKMNFYYDSWGKTTVKKEDEEIICFNQK